MPPTLFHFYPALSRGMLQDWLSGGYLDLCSSASVVPGLLLLRCQHGPPYGA